MALAFGHATRMATQSRSTFNLLNLGLGLWPRYANGHAIAFNLQPDQPSTFNLINIQPST
ncbi:MULTISPECIES: hypothetical protein [unclassified Moorena]|uniref:hypothetical protein n=1 Tax=unclassified Moorena TaxID=2683338 RepID=UPI001400154E|nr:MULTISPECIES: hypothetical protein [unclassified Moorena]NEO11192.1 hypothetical protein [Moorena sp. SIO3E8]NEQ00127.1 hypothetical protein [Moorena sp. SIO3F7]